MRRLQWTLSPLCASALACAALAAACGDSSSGVFPDGLGGGGGDTVAANGGGQGANADAGASNSAPGSGNAGSGATDASTPVQADSGGPAPLPDGGAVTRDGAAGATCVVGSAGALGLIPGGTMSPGGACVSCHAATGAGKLNVAGTVYTGLHEPDNCIGIASGVTVVITDAKGTAHTLSVNSSGNFYDNSLFGFSTPYTAKVVSASGSIAMLSSQTNGDCNACHTSAGAQGAAGRIVGP